MDVDQAVEGTEAAESTPTRAQPDTQSAELNHLRLRVRDLERDNRSLSATLESVKGSYETVVTERDALKSEITAREQRIGELESTLTERDEALTSAQSESAETVQQLESALLRAEFGDLPQELFDQLKLEGDLEERRKALEATRSALGERASKDAAEQVAEQVAGTSPSASKADLSPQDARDAAFDYYEQLIRDDADPAKIDEARRSFYELDEAALAASNQPDVWSPNNPWGSDVAKQPN